MNDLEISTKELEKEIEYRINKMIAQLGEVLFEPGELFLDL